MFQYTVRNHRIPGAPVVVRLRSHAQAVGWCYMRTSVRCTDRARYGLATMEKRAASIVQYGMLGRRDMYL